MKIIKSFWKTIICVTVIISLSVMSGNEIPHVSIPHIDKIVHFIMYFTFALALIHDFLHYSKIHLKHWQIVLLSIVSVIAMGGFLEILQRIPYIHRSSDFFDFLANAIGAVIASIVYKLFEPLLNKINALFIKQ
jgi:VanZ family protein